MPEVAQTISVSISQAVNSGEESGSAESRTTHVHAVGGGKVESAQTGGCMGREG